MTSLQTNTRQNHNDLGYFINVGPMGGQVNALNPTTGALQIAVWAATTSTLAQGSYQSSMSTIGTAIFRDLGKTYVSSNRSFRKVQLQLNGNAYSTTQGVGGRSGTTPFGEDYLTGYVELGFDGIAPPAPLARFGR